MRENKNRFQKRMMYFSFGILALIALFAIIINPAALAVGALAILPIFGSVADKTFKELTAEQISKLEASDQIKYFDELKLYKEAQMTELKDQLKKDNNDALNKQIAELREQMQADNGEQMKAINKALEAQGLALNKLLTNGGAGNTSKTLEDILKEKATELKAMSTNSSSSLKFTVDKATVLTSAVADSTLAYIDPRIGRIKRPRNVIRQLFNSTGISEALGGTVRWLEYALDTNGAAFQTEGSLKGEGAMSWIEKSMPVQLIAEWIKVSKQALSDFGFIAGEIRNKLMRDLESTIDAKLFSGTGNSPEIKGIYTYADTYVPVASGIPAATIYDLIPKVYEDIAGATDYMPNAIVMNIADINDMKLAKDANNNYILPPFANLAGMQVDGMTVVESSKVTANTLLMGDFDFADLYTLGTVDITMGYENQDFTKNLVTILAEERLALVVKGTDTGAFRKVTDIAAALVTLKS